MRVRPPVLRGRCVTERAKAIRDHPELAGDIRSDSVCSNEAEIERERRELLDGLASGKVCASEDF